MKPNAVENDLAEILPPKAESNRFGTILFILVVGLLFGNVFYFADLATKHLEPVVWEQWLFRLDFRYWHGDVSYLLWGILAWLLIDAMTFRRRQMPVVDEQGNANTVRVLVFTVKLVVASALAISFLDSMRIKVFRTLLMEYYYVPLVCFFENGTLSWKLVLLPLTATIVFGVLLRLKRRFQ